MLAALIHNANATEPRGPGEFFPSLKGPADPKRQREELMRRMLEFHAHFGGDRHALTEMPLG